ncbi:hypothetical protein DTL21_09340 [Bremerella cremea]|uniref:Uncharacterized protein n=1 Tax=Blastopirellula marina TaxID=124 RepID=A0A2S8FV99_9BACT|nr:MULTISPECIES: hypothetical protein [Pirellulaceae]PQO36112.1 hypothetical protein C5Y83_09335 [Blastopirellula marina]RCS48789.1 hypothetical protein DTL21_09340 [Bremerella cremea]
MDEVFRWRYIMAMMRSVAKGPNYIFSGKSADVAGMDAGSHVMSVYYESPEDWRGIGVYRTQSNRDIFRRFIWKEKLDKSMFHEELDSQGMGVVRAPLQVQIEYWITRDPATSEVDTVVSRIAKVLLDRAEILAEGNDFEGRFPDDRDSMFSCIRVRHGTGSLIQDGVDFKVYSGEVRFLERCCNLQYCRSLDCGDISEMYYCDIYAGDPSVYGALDLLNLPRCLYEGSI